MTLAQQNQAGQTVLGLTIARQSSFVQAQFQRVLIERALVGKVTGEILAAVAAVQRGGKRHPRHERANYQPCFTVCRHDGNHTPDARGLQ